MTRTGPKLIRRLFSRPLFSNHDGHNASPQPDSALQLSPLLLYSLASPGALLRPCHITRTSASKVKDQAFWYCVAATKLSHLSCISLPSSGHIYFTFTLNRV